jgi:NAD(P)-dependent dehydrogenase (short-subunit alcohol dehydrogenase family)
METAFITGANKGIGFEIARNLGKRGYRVLVGARDRKRGQDAVASLSQQGYSAGMVLVDTSDLQSVNLAAELVARECPELCLLVNNAGTPGYQEALQPQKTDAADVGKAMTAPGWEFTADILELTWRTNFLGHFQLIKGLMDTLARNRGKILSVSIPTDPSPMFNAFAYQTSKASLNAMTKSLGLSFEKAGIPVEILAVAPGATSTDLNGHIQGPHVKTPEQAAEAIVGFAFDGKRHNGQVINFDGTVY